MLDAPACHLPQGGRRARVRLDRGGCGLRGTRRAGRLSGGPRRWRRGRWSCEWPTKRCRSARRAPRGATSVRVRRRCAERTASSTPAIGSSCVTGATTSWAARGGVINVGGLKVHPEEVEAVINAHPWVRMSLVKARRNPITGAVVTAEVVLAEQGGRTHGRPRRPLTREITESCRRALSRAQGAGDDPHRAGARGVAGRQAGAPACVTSSSPARAAGWDLRSRRRWPRAAIA